HLRPAPRSVVLLCSQSRPRSGLCSPDPMRPPRVGALRRAILTGVLAFALVSPGRGSAEESQPTNVLDSETGAGKSYLIPALAIPAFGFVLNQCARHVYDSPDYDSDWHSIWKNLRTAPVYDTDPFNVNQLDHPYVGSLYYGFARSAGLNFWESMGYTL